MWTDKVAIKKQLEDFSIILKWAKEVGFYGVTIDMEPYRTSLWGPNTDRFDNIPLCGRKDKGFKSLFSL